MQLCNSVLEQRSAASELVVLDTKIPFEALAGKDQRGDTRTHQDAAFSKHQPVYESWIPGEYRRVEMQNEIHGK